MPKLTTLSYPVIQPFPPSRHPPADDDEQFGPLPGHLLVPSIHPRPQRSGVEDVHRLVNVHQDRLGPVDSPLVFLEQITHHGFEPDISFLIPQLLGHDRQEGFHDVFQDVLG
jgi:hypothetical protein